MQNQHELEIISVRLYRYLCDDIFVSQNIDRYIRLYFKLHNDMWNYTQVLSSGSWPEGLDLPGSDFDTMVLSWEVHEDKPKDKEDVLMLDTNNSLPGFAWLKTVDSSSIPLSQT